MNGMNFATNFLRKPSKLKSDSWQEYATGWILIGSKFVSKLKIFKQEIVQEPINYYLFAIHIFN
jgi:hypothetical protein